MFQAGNYIESVRRHAKQICNSLTIALQQVGAFSNELQRDLIDPSSYRQSIFKTNVLTNLYNSCSYTDLNHRLHLLVKKVGVSYPMFNEYTAVCLSTLRNYINQEFIVQLAATRSMLTYDFDTVMGSGRKPAIWKTVRDYHNQSMIQPKSIGVSTGQVSCKWYQAKEAIEMNAIENIENSIYADRFRLLFSDLNNELFKQYLLENSNQAGFDSVIKNFMMFYASLGYKLLHASIEENDPTFTQFGGEGLHFYIKDDYNVVVEQRLFFTGLVEISTGYQVKFPNVVGIIIKRLVTHNRQNISNPFLFSTSEVNITTHRNLEKIHGIQLSIMDSNAVQFKSMNDLSHHLQGAPVKVLNIFDPQLLITMGCDFTPETYFVAQAIKQAWLYSDQMIRQQNSTEQRLIGTEDILLYKETKRCSFRRESAPI